MITVPTAPIPAHTGYAMPYQEELFWLLWSEESYLKDKEQQTQYTTMPLCIRFQRCPFQDRMQSLFHKNLQ